MSVNTEYDWHSLVQGIRVATTAGSFILDLGLCLLVKWCYSPPILAAWVTTGESWMQENLLVRQDIDILKKPRIFFLWIKFTCDNSQPQHWLNHKCWDHLLTGPNRLGWHWNITGPNFLGPPDYKACHLLDKLGVDNIFCWPHFIFSMGGRVGDNIRKMKKGTYIQTWLRK